MKIEKNIQKYIVFSEDTVCDALKKINENKSKILFVVSEHAKLLGSITDGDIRRWLIKCENLDLNISVRSIMERGCKFITVNEDKSSSSSLFKDGVNCVPVVDSSGHLVSLLFAKEEALYISQRKISNDVSAFIIAEIGNNHQGDIYLAKKLVDHAVSAGADCAKFQMRNLKQLYKNEGNCKDNSADLGVQYTIDLLDQFQLTKEELFEVFDYCKESGIIPLCTPWDLRSLIELEKYGMSAYKIASADFTNYELLKAISETGKTFICSTGMSTENEIKRTVRFLDKLGSEYILLHCNSTYPTPFKDVNLRYISRLKKITNKLVGYSGHERGICVPIGAVALGACVIEKHLTVNKTLEGTDHKVSLLPEEFSEMVLQIRNLESGLGSSNYSRELSQGEMINRESLAKSLVAKDDIKIESIITRNMICIRSPGQGIQPNRIDDIVGKRSQRNIKRGDFFFESDIYGKIEKKENYSFSCPVGVPVRYHDYKKIIQGVNLDFVEFHMSYKDIDLEPSDFFSKKATIEFAVHSPELFSGDHILDLCADDDVYRQRSISELHRVIEATRKLKNYFPKTQSPVIVVNAGGWSHKGFVSSQFKENKYLKIIKSFSDIDISGVQIAIQTMPPFPWHFGGQSYHNLFVCANEITKFCSENTDIKICLDVSHSMMACTYYGWNLIKFIEQIAPYVVHIHLSDAKGVDGEGVEIGKGDVDFIALASVLNKSTPNISFIPEIWQGHKNDGEGFWHALNYLEKIIF